MSNPTRDIDPTAAARARRGRNNGGRNISGEKRRLGLALGVIALTFLAVVVRLWSIQVAHGDEYAEIARRQSTGKIPLPAPRGVIFDRSGREVAVNVISRGISIYPRSQEEATAAAHYLDKLFGKQRGFSQKRWDIQPHRFRWIRRGIDDALARQVSEEAPGGVYIKEEQGRTYPYGLIGKQILGYTDIDNTGISGVEALFNEQLRGHDGSADIQRDGLSNTYQVNERPLIEPRPGQSIVLTLDWEFQEIVEDELRRATEDHNAQGGMAVFVDCRTGETLAAAHYDPQEERPERPTKLKAITDTFEPGSIYKVIAAAALLDAGLARPDTLIYCEKGVWQVGRRRLRDDKELDSLSFHDIIAKSSNIGVGKLALLLGGPNLVEASKRFGIGQKTRVDFPGEQSGILHDDMPWSEYNVAALSIGHSVTVTPMQMALAMAAIANGGELLRPRILRGVVGDAGVVRDYREPEVVCRVASERALALLRPMLESVVDTGGTAEKTMSAIVSLAGKTGTAEIPRPDGKGYFKNKFIASFAGYFPADKPQIAGIVLLDRPEPIHYGGYTSGPAFRAMAERYALAHPERFGPPEHRLLVATENHAEVSDAPRFVGLTHWKAAERAAEHGVTLKGAILEGDVIWQYPAPGAPLGDDKVVAVHVAPAATPGAQPQPNTGTHTTPDLTGLTVRQAALLLARLNMPFTVEGYGRIIDQRPLAGSIINSGATVALRGRTLIAAR
ncbi:MAG TPA: penicillin-binding transpeptidase domain-containing protein [candidate division Zixibacteria bacterium]|nr:penicillin-binding transpeptidase domain-containing protein [candidate division Zixibacteria bacterium]